MHTEAAGRDLHDGICAVLVEILMQTALAGVVVDAERFCGAGKAFVRIVADGAVGHGREHDRHGKLKRGVMFVLILPFSSRSILDGF